MFYRLVITEHTLICCPPWDFFSMECVEDGLIYVKEPLTLSNISCCFPFKART